MRTESIFIAHPTTIEQVNALKAVGKALKVKFEIKKERVQDDTDVTKDEIIGNLKKGFEEMKLIQQGKGKTTSLKSFLDEL